MPPVCIWSRSRRRLSEGGGRFQRNLAASSLISSRICDCFSVGAECPGPSWQTHCHKFLGDVSTAADWKHNVLFAAHKVRDGRAGGIVADGNLRQHFAARFIIDPEIGVPLSDVKDSSEWVIPWPYIDELAGLH